MHIPSILHKGCIVQQNQKSVLQGRSASRKRSRFKRGMMNSTIARWLTVVLMLVSSTYYIGEAQSSASSEEFSLQYKYCSRGNRSEVCVPVDLCVNGRINIIGEGIISERFGLDDTVKRISEEFDECNRFNVVCCKAQESSTTASTTNTADVIQSSKGTSASPPVSTITTKEFSNFIPNLKQGFRNGEFSFGECGQLNRYGVIESTIEEESLANYGEYPWMAALFQVNRENGEKRYCCNGALVETYAVLTTAHCLSICGSNHTNMVVRLGEWIMNSTVEPIPHEDIDVEQMFKHPNYTHTSLINNIAVVVLNGSVEYKPTVQPICLPSSEEELGSRTNMIATGWGTTVVQTNAGAKTPTKVLKRMDLHSEPLTNCENIIKDNRPFKLHSSFACTSTEHLERPCAGDAGAPVVIEKRPTNDRFYLYGLVSWGFHCLSEKRKETVVTKVEEFKDWIDGILNNSSM